MVFGFSSGNVNIHDTIYSVHLGKPVRVDVSGGIGGTGILKACDSRFPNSYVIHLYPYVAHFNGSPEVIQGTHIIDTSGSPSSVSSLEMSLEDFVIRVKKSKGKKTDEKK
ncbi:MAG: hypothetical protein WC494_03285 [Candidatus Pacearchaeota archaeon]